jgi:prolyl-tRNA editing enzyme YbaK/EbsC (Cys-tRNA(Pro) deacylase)
MDNVNNILKSSEYDYEFIFHEQPISSAQEGADYFKIAIGQTAPTLIIKADSAFFALIISGNRSRVDFRHISKILGCHHAQMASRREVKKLTGFDVGSVPMIGIPLPFILDRQLFSYPFVYGGSGQATRTLKITPIALQQLNQVVVIMD